MSTNDNQGSSPLCRACRNSYEKIVDLLLQNDANVNVVGGQNPIFIACQKGYSSIVENYLKRIPC